MFTRFLLPLAATALLVFAVAQVMDTHKPSPNSAPLIEPPHNPYSNTVAGAGMVEPELENVAIGSPIPGVVVEVFAKVGQKLKPGTPLFRLDERQLQAELDFRKSAAEAAQAELTKLENQPRPEQLQMSQASLAEAEANLADQRDQLKRTRDLYSRKVTTDMDLVAHEQATRMSQARYARAKAEHAMQKAGAWQYDKAVAKAAVDQAEAQVKQTQTELERLTVRSQADGEVLQVNVRPGEFVGAPPSQALVVVGNLDKLHVRVDIDEYDIPRFVPGAPARASIKGQPKQQFALKFVRVEPYVIPKKSLTGDNTERVDTRVLPVIYELERGDRQFWVGQQLDVFIEAAGNSAEANSE